MAVLEFIENHFYINAKALKVDFDILFYEKNTLTSLTQQLSNYGGADCF